MELSLSDEQRAAVLQQLNFARDGIWAGKCIDITVEDMALGRALVAGETAPLKVAVDKFIESHPGTPLNAQKVTFMVVDFRTIEDAEQAQEELFQRFAKLPEIGSEGRGAPGTFSEVYPGIVIVLIGAESIPHRTNCYRLKQIVRKAPTVFIRDKNKKDFESRDAYDAYGANVDGGAHHVKL